MSTEHLVRFQQAPGVLSRSLGDEVIVTALGSGGVDSLRGAVGSAWQLLDVPRTLPDLTRLLAVAYGKSAEEIAGDVEGVLDDLLCRGWIEEVIESDV